MPPMEAVREACSLSHRSRADGLSTTATTYEITYVDGKEDHRKAVSEKMLKEPVSQVVTKGTKQRRRIVSKQKVEDCDGSGHGYYIITWSDGKVEYQDY